MPIAFACPSCSARFEVDDSLGGKKCKCTRCGSQFIVPATAAPVARKAVPPPLPADDDVPRKRRRVADEEDDRPRAKPRRDEDDRSRDKRRKDDDDENDRPRSRRRPEEDDDEDDDRSRSRRHTDDDDDEDRPRHSRYRGRRSRKKMVLLIGGALGLLTVLLAVGLIWYFWTSGPGPDIKYLPDNSQIVVSIKVEDLLNSKAYKQLKDEFGDPIKGVRQLDDMESEAGLSLKDISSVLIGGEVAGGKEDFVMAIRTVKAMKDRDLLANMKEGKFTEVKAGRYTIHEKDRFGFCVPESNVVVFGPTDTLKKVLQRDKDPDFSSGLKEAIKETDFSKTFALAMNIKDVMRKEGKGGSRGPFGGGGVFDAVGADELAKDAEGLSMTVSVKSDISWKVSVIFKDRKSADDAKKLVDAAVVKMKQKSKEMPAAIRDLIDTTEYKVSGNRLETSGGIETAKLIKLIKSFKDGKF